MNNSIKKIVAGISTVAMMVTAMPIVGAYADEVDFKTRANDNGEGVIITEYVGEDTAKITIPSEIDGKTVVGVDNFAFGLVSQPVTIVVPETLKADTLGSEAFMTAAVINDEFIAVSEATTINGIMDYWVNDKLGMGYDEDQIADAVKKALLHVGDVQTGESTVLSMCVAVIKATQAGECDFSQSNIARLNEALSLIPYNDVTLQGPDETEVQEYASGKWNLEYVVSSSVIPGDVNGNGRLDLQDIIAVAKHRLNAPALTKPEELEAADYDGNGKIDLQDMIAMAKARLVNDSDNKTDSENKGE